MEWVQDIYYYVSSDQFYASNEVNAVKVCVVTGLCLTILTEVVTRLCKLYLSKTEKSIWFSIICLISVFSAIGIYGSFQNFEKDERLHVLSTALNTGVKGQVASVTAIIDALKGYQNSRSKDQRQKAFVLSFHGLPGTGMSTMSNLLARKWTEVRWGSSDDYFTGIYTFKNKDKMTPFQYQKHLRKQMKLSLVQNKRSIFILKDIDFLSDEAGSLFNSLQWSLKTKKFPHSEQVIVILNSNIGGHHIASAVLRHFLEGGSRESMDMKTLESSVKSTFNDMSGPRWYRRITDYGVKVNIIPFLPLERHHIQDYIKERIRNSTMFAKLYGNTEKGTKRLIHDVMKDVTFFPKGYEYFANGGFKSVKSALRNILM